MFQFVRQLFSNAKPETDLSYGLIDQLGIAKLLAARDWTALEATAAQLPADDLTRLLDNNIQRYKAVTKQVTTHDMVTQFGDNTPTSGGTTSQ